MFPYLEIPGFKIPMYGLMIAIGVVFGGLYFFLVTLKEEKFSKTTFIRMFLCVVLSTICLVIGASLFDSLFHSLKEGKPVIGGITWLGGVVTAFPIFVLLSELLIPAAKGKAMKFVSLLIPSIVLAHAFGRVGCFCAGCCYGKVTDSVLGVQFPFLEEKVLPTQLFETAFDLVLFIVMAVFRKKIKYHNFEIYFLTYGIFRFFIEFLRGDDRGATSSILSPAQLLSIVIIFTSIVIAYRYAVKEKTNRQISIAGRENHSLLFASEEVFKLSLSWKNAFIIVTPLVLILVLTACGQNNCHAFETCGNYCETCTCSGCFCRFMGSDANYSETVQAMDEGGVNNACATTCNSCKDFASLCNCNGSNSTTEIIVRLLGLARNALHALLSSIKEVVNFN